MIEKNLTGPKVDYSAEFVHAAAEDVRRWYVCIAFRQLFVCIKVCAAGLYSRSRYEQLAKA